MTSRNFTVAIVALLFLTIPAHAATPPTSTATVKPLPECASARTATECADTLKRLGKNPFDAFDYPDSVYAAQTGTPLPPCRNGSPSCQPWERDWSNTPLPPGAIVTDQGIILTPLAKPITGLQWVQVASVFLAAFLAMCTGIALEFFKNWRTIVKEQKEKQRREVAQIKVALAGIAFNIESLLHAVFQNLLPHHEQSRVAYKELQTTKGDGERISQFAIALHRYPALMMTCPEMRFVEWDFFKELPFVVEKDPELLKQAGWLLRRAREINNAISDRNSYIQAAINLTASQKGGLNYYQLDGVLQRQVSISDAECVTAHEFFSMLLDTAKRLEAISGTYKVPGAQTRLIPPEPLAEAMSKLAEIHKEAVAQMPGYQWPGPDPH